MRVGLGKIKENITGQNGEGELKCLEMDTIRSLVFTLAPRRKVGLGLCMRFL